MNRKFVSVIVGLVAVVSLGACTSGSEEDRTRGALQAQKAVGPTLEKTNLAAKREREENPDAIGYVYLYAFNTPVGYYITKGKVSSSGSQSTPEQDIHWTCRDHHGCQPVVVDGPQDDGSYGGHDTGIFFFLADGTKIVTGLEYIHSDRPIPALNVPLFGGSAG